MNHLNELRLPEIIELGDYSVFTDETDLTARYMIIGGLTIGTRFIHELDGILSRYRNRMPFRERLEWKAISKKNVHIFEELIRDFCEWNEERLVDFHALSVDMHKFDHARFNGGDREVSFDKMLFQSFFAVHQRYRACQTVRCFHGNRDSRYPIENLRPMLNAKAPHLDEEGFWRSPDYVQVSHVTVKQQPISQLADLLIGCTGAKWNNRKGLKEGTPKVRIASYFQSQSPAYQLDSKTPFNMKHFDIWPFRL